MKITIGCDPEVFVKNTKSFISGHELIPGTKAHPYKVPWGAVQVDGMALEFNIDPAKNQEEFVHNIKHVLNTLKGMIPNNLKIAIEPIARFNPNYMKKQPEISKLLGCDPDYNAYTESENPAPNSHPTMRTAAGHIHIGWKKETKLTRKHIKKCVLLIKELDFTLGIPSMLVDGCGERRELYGKAGAFRPKPYGVEYRVLSNYWLKETKLIQLIYHQAYFTTKRVLADDCSSYYHRYGDLARNIIDYNDIKEARKFTETFDLSLPVGSQL